MILTQLKQQIIDHIAKLSGVVIDENVISVPPKPELGDLAVPMFIIAKSKGKDAVSIAHELSTVPPPGTFIKVIPVGPYLNFFINTSVVGTRLLNSILKEKNFGSSDIGKGKRVMVEYFSPNTNKPMHVGHLRNITLGSAVIKLHKKSGYKTIPVMIYNDRGIAICKSMVAYDLFANGETPKTGDQKPDQFVGDYYVRFGREAEKDAKFEEMAKEYLILWEKGDKRIRALWKKMNNWVYAGMKQTLAKLNLEKFDLVFYESEIYDRAKEVVLKNVGNGVIKRGQEGEIYADLESKGLPNKILLRSDGTSLYITQDLFLAELKNKNNLDKSIYVVADEQNLQFQQIFAVLESLEQKSDKYFHLSYGMMRLPEGKIKSREGFGRALADTLINELEALAFAEVEKRHEKLSDRKKHKIANQIMNAALKFYIINIDPKKIMVFDPAEAISFSGKTGPYLQYTAVRLNSILKEVKKSAKPDFVLLAHDLEKQIINILKDYPDVISRATEKYDPSTLSKYLYELAQVVNHYYHDVPILKSEPKMRSARIGLIRAVNKVMSDGLEICGIEIPEKM